MKKQMKHELYAGAVDLRIYLGRCVESIQQPLRDQVYIKLIAECITSDDARLCITGELYAD